MMKPLVYIAGPYTHPDPVSNTARAAGVFHRLLGTGLVAPICPHVSLLLHFARPRPVQEWYAYDLEVLRRCDAMFVLTGPSTGVDAEVRFAEANGIPIYNERTHSEFIEWAKRWITEEGGGTIPDEPCVHVKGEPA